MLRGVMLVQAALLLLYGLPYLLVPRLATTLTQQLPLPENYLLRAMGISFVVLAYLEWRIASDLARYRDLALAYALLPALFLVTILLQSLVRGFNGAPWFWMVNAAVSAIFTVAVFATHREA